LTNAINKQKNDLLAILEARMLQFQIEKQTGPEIEAETRRLAEAALKELAESTNDEETHQAALDVLRSLPARTAAEIALLRQYAEQTVDPRIQGACAYALDFAQPLNDEAWHEIEMAQKSEVKGLAEVARKVMERKR
jgi:hypothetical protein